MIPLDEEMTHNRATADQGAGAPRATGDTSAALVCVRIDVMRYVVAQARTGRPGMAPMGVAQEFARVFLAAKYTAEGWFSAPTLRGSVSRWIILRVETTSRVPGPGRRAAIVAQSRKPTRAAVQCLRWGARNSQIHRGVRDGGCAPGENSRDTDSPNQKPP